MTKKTILILGGSRYSLNGLRTLQQNGYDVVCVDKDAQAAARTHARWFEPCDLIDVAAVTDIAKKYRVHAVVPLNDYGVMTAAEVSQALGLVGLTPAVARHCCDKSEMRQTWSQNGVACPRFKIAQTAAEINACAAQIGYPCILKPAKGRGGASRGVIVVNDPSELAHAIAYTHSFYADKTTLVEEFVLADSEHSAEALIGQNKIHVLTIGDKIKTPLPYRVDRSVLYPTALSPAQKDVFTVRMAHAIAALGITVGAAHVEFGVVKNDVVFFELGARCGGGGTADPIVPHVTGINYFLQFVRVLCGEELQLGKALAAQKACCYHFFTPAAGILKKAHGLEGVRGSPHVLDVDVTKKSGEKIPVVRCGVDRAGFVITTGLSRQDAYERALAAENMISFEYA